MSQYAFYFDSSSCSGCKACQVACKDRNGLEPGRLWRRVYEVSGGDWRQSGAAWIAETFAYNLSIACNHCEKPLCAEACPAAAITKRPDGIVVLDSGRCIGCQYCSWACPYGAPQYDPAAGCMTKCDFCVESLEAGGSPACVAACGLRALEYGIMEPISAGTEISLPSAKFLPASQNGSLVRSVAPMPAEQLTLPAAWIKPHPQAERAQAARQQIANKEEVQTGMHTNGLPLVFFTVLAQMSVGALLVIGALSMWVSAHVGPATASSLFSGPLLAAGVALALGLPGSMFHLGRPLQAYRALLNLRTSWLSREILFAGLYAAGLAAFSGLLIWRSSGGVMLQVAYLAAGAAGLGLVYSMARIYRLGAIPVWDRWTTPGSFWVTTGLLGLLLSGMALSPVLERLALFPRVDQWIGVGAFIGLHLVFADLFLQMLRRSVDQEGERWSNVEPVLSAGTGVALLAMLLAGDQMNLPALLALAFALALAGQLLGRWRFYAAGARRDF